MCMTSSICDLQTTHHSVQAIYPSARPNQSSKRNTVLPSPSQLNLPLLFRFFAGRTAHNRTTASRHMRLITKYLRLTATEQAAQAV